jgi:CHASE3 domain sensor protein
MGNSHIRLGNVVTIGTLVGMLIIALTCFCVKEHYDLQESQRQREISRRVTQLNHIFLVVKETESGQRGYLLTGNILYAADYYDGVRRLKSAMANANEMLKSTEVNKQNQVGILNDLVDIKLKEMASTITAFQGTPGLPSAVAIVNTNQGLRTTQQIQVVIQILADFERHREHITLERYVPRFVRH